MTRGVDVDCRRDGLLECTNMGNSVHGMIRGVMMESQPTSTDAADTRARLIARVKALLGPDAAVPDPFPVERKLSDLGVSSLKMVNLMLAVEMEFDIAIPQSDITPENFNSVFSIETLISRLLLPT